MSSALSGSPSSLSSDAITATSTVTSTDETTSTTSVDETTTAFAAAATTMPLSRPVAPKPRFKPVWRLPVWDFFTICQDKKFAKCEECEEVVSHDGDCAKTFTTSNLVSHLRMNHPNVYQRFCKCKDKKVSQRQDVRKE